jgi:hypothetical protein
MISAKLEISLLSASEESTTIAIVVIISINCNYGKQISRWRIYMFTIKIKIRFSGILFLGLLSLASHTEESVQSGEPLELIAEMKQLLEKDNLSTQFPNNRDRLRELSKRIVEQGENVIPLLESWIDSEKNNEVRRSLSFSNLGENTR